MDARIPFLAIALGARVLLASTEFPNGECVDSVGLPRADRTPWAATMKLTVSAKGDASRIEFKAGVEHAGTVVYQFLRSLRFRDECRGRRLEISVSWSPSQDGRFGVYMKNDQFFLTSWQIVSPRRNHGGPLQFEREEVDTMRTTPSLGDFLEKRHGARR